MHTHRQDARALAAALALTAAFLLVEIAGAWATNSLALLSDAAHMFTDVAALGLGLFGSWVAAQPPSEKKTFGYHRAEILVALLNGMGLLVAVLWVVHEAYGRLWSPAPVRGAGMLAVASGGLVTNVACACLLAPHRGASLNARAAFLHVLGDLLGSVGAIVAAGVILLTGWYVADALASFVIGALVLVGAWRLIGEALDILMEAVPRHIDLDRLRRDLEGVPGTRGVHDLHVWTLATGRHALSAHAVIDGSIDADSILARMREILAERFEVDHVTIQLESASPCEPASVHL